MDTNLVDRLNAAMPRIWATRGKNKGRLLASAPPSHTDEYAAWQGAMIVCNPYKASIASWMFMTTEQRAIADAVRTAFEQRPDLAKRADRDRAALETFGVW